MSDAADGSRSFDRTTTNSNGNAKDAELQELDVDMIDADASDSTFDPNAPALASLRTTIRKWARIHGLPAPRLGITKNAIPRNGAKKSSAKKSNSAFSQWRTGQEGEELDVEKTPRTTREKSKLERENEEKAIGGRIQELAAGMGWTQRHRADQRTIKRNSVATPYIYKEEIMALCQMCNDKVAIADSTRLRCKHRHCNDCLQRNFQMVIRDPSLWPAKCCQPLDHQLAYGVLTKEEFQEFLDVKHAKEYSSSASCYNCHKQLLTVNIVANSTGFCTACEHVTCVHCTKAMHEGACLLDPETEKLIKVAKGRKWSKCPRCSNMVERNTGCNSILCRADSPQCTQIEFESDMWQKQAPHQPLQIDANKIAEYRDRSKQGEDELLAARTSMTEKHDKAREQHELVSEILSLRARLDKITQKRSGLRHRPSPTPAPATFSAGIERLKNNVPDLVEFLDEDDKPQEEPVEVPSLLDKFRKTMPEMMKQFDEKEPSTFTENTEWPAADNKVDLLVSTPPESRAVVQNDSLLTPRFAPAFGPYGS
ncbi:hypothetical protein ABW21_db0204201 [Orbilia brochopaga]|nr:hypothetical protein ABW21_db0204201 [Drechslerella brochopaga]